MNYQKIHDSLIERARHRVYDSSIHHNHHIIPLHEDENSTETVPLIIKEHALIHRLRWKLGFGTRNQFAYILLKECTNSRASAAGMIGGKITKENKNGIFSDSWDRSAETKRRHEEGIIVSSLTTEQAKKIGILSFLSGKGIHDPNYDHSAANKALWASGKMDDVPYLSSISHENYLNGIKQRDEGKGIHADAETRAKWAGMGGSVSAKMPRWNNGVINIKRNEHPGEGWESGWLPYRNNGVIQIMCHEVPEGFVKGKLKK